MPDLKILGEQNDTQGIIRAWNGEEFSPGLLQLADSEGTLYSIWVTTGGVVRIVEGEPTSDSDGTAIGAQT